MNELIQKHDNGTAVATPPVNVDGKGANGFMLDWYRTQPRGVVVKPQRQVLAEFFTSMLALSADFKYKPAIGVSNYLYWIDGDWNLSLIAPEQWTDERQAGFVGIFTMQPDMTWTVEPSDNLQQNGQLAEAVRLHFDAFAETLDTDLTLEDILPFYVQRLPYWQRLHANALSRSVRATARMGGLDSMSARDWQQALPSSDTFLRLAES